MDSEASETDQTVGEPIQDTKEANGLKNGEVTVSETKDGNGKEDEIKLEDAIVVDTIASIQEELKQRDSETQIIEDTKESDTNDDKSASESSIESAQKEVETGTNLSNAQVVEVPKEEEKETAESVEKEEENETSLPDTQKIVTDQVEEVTKDEAKDNDATVEPVESVVNEAEDPANLPDSQDVQATKEEANDGKTDLEPTVESSEKQMEIEIVSPPTQDSETQSLEVIKEEAKAKETTLEPSSESVGTEVGNANNLSGTQENDSQVTEEVKEEVKNNQDLEPLVELAQEELDSETKISGTPEPSNERAEKSTDMDTDTVQKPETQINKEPVAPEVVSKLSEVSVVLASESVVEDEVVEPPSDKIQEPTDDVCTVNNSDETTTLSQDDVVETVVVSDTVTTKQDDDPSVSSDATPLSQDEKTTDHEVQVKFEQSNELPSSNDTSESTTEDANSELQQTAESESLLAGNPTQVVSEPKDVVETVVVSDIVTTKQDDDSNVSSDTKESEHENGDTSVDVLPTAATTATENEAILESELDAKEKEQEDSVEVEKPTLAVTSEVEKATITETADSIAENDGAKVSQETKEAEKKDETSENTSRDFDAVAIEGKESTSVSELDAPIAEPKQAEVKQTLRDKFASEASEDKKEVETGNVADRSPDETTVTKDGDDTKTGEEAPKEDTPAKPSQRQSSNIISKVKKSIVKVKKAIIGKSPSSKTTTSESKDTTEA